MNNHLENILKTSNDNINKLLEATEVTDQVFVSRGYSKGLVDITTYFETGNLKVFTEENGARSLMASIPLNELCYDVEQTLLDSTIIVVGNPDAIPNNLQQEIIRWSNSKSNIDPAEFLNMLMINPKYSHDLLQCLQTVGQRFQLVLAKKDANQYPLEVEHTINALLQSKKELEDE